MLAIYVLFYIVYNQNMPKNITEHEPKTLKKKKKKRKNLISFLIFNFFFQFLSTNEYEQAKRNKLQQFWTQNHHSRSNAGKWETQNKKQSEIVYELQEIAIEVKISKSWRNNLWFCEDRP
jgi:hypothetical protein